MEQKRCPGCMREKQNTPRCEHCGHDERTTNAPHQLPPGTVLNNQYIVGKVLGQGGFGITYMGWDQYLSIPVAIKEFYPSGIVMREASTSTSVFLVTEQAKDSFVSNRDRFVREATSLARLGRNRNMDSIVRVQNLVQANNTAYIVMEYVEGIDLRRYMKDRGGKLSVEETFQLLLPVMESLEKVHESHIVHRDISPDNIMVLPDGSTKLIDFGAAHEVQQDAQGNIKSTEAILKYGFAPIEQYQRRGELGPWTDVYAMCASIYYCLTGKLPPHATDRMIGDEDFEWNLIPSLSPGKLQALKKGTAIRRQDRHQTMAQLRHALLEEELNIPPVIGTISMEDVSTVSKTLPLYTAPIMHQSEPGAYTHTATADQSLYTAPVGQAEQTAPVEASFTQQHRKHGKTRILIGIATLVVATAAGFALLKPETGIIPVETPPEIGFPETNGAIEQPVSWEDNILAHEDDSRFVWGTEVSRDKIATVTFLDSLEQEPDNSWYVSENKDGIVKAWTKPNGNLYDLYIAAEGGINGRSACRSMFYKFTNLEKISFNGAFHTEHATDMSKMFYFCESLTHLDLSGFETSNVTDMSDMFYGCALTELDVSGFETSNVTDMSLMFTSCGSLMELDLSSFNTSRVTTMSGMFRYCKNMKTLDVSSFDTSNVTNMSGMFHDCEVLTTLDVSRFDTSKVINMGEMFFGTTKLTDISMPMFDTSNVSKASKLFTENVMDAGDTINGKPWKSYFK